MFRAESFDDKYTELYASTKEGIGAFLGNRSIVIHRGDDKKTRLACTNFFLKEGSTNGTSLNGTLSTSPSNDSDSGASSFGFSSAIAVGGLLAGLVMAL